MNRNGQTLIIFVIMIPIFLILAALVIDIGLMTNEKLKLSGTTTTILKEHYELRDEADVEDKIKTLWIKNGLPADNLKITIKENSLSIENKYEISSVFGNLIGIKNYPISIHKTIFEENGKIKITEE